MRFASTIVAVLSLTAFTACNDSHLSGVSAGIEVNPETITFAATLPGSTNTKTATIKNNGGGVLSITSLEMGGQTPDSFSTDIAASAFPLELGASETVQVQVTFAPGETGPHAGVMTVHSSDANRPAIDVNLVTVGLAPAITVAPDALAFGTVTSGQVHLQSFTVSNSGNAPLNVSSIALSANSSATYTVFPPALPQVLQPGASFSVPVAYAPQGDGFLTGTVLVASDDPAAPEVPVALSGIATPANVPDIFATPTSLAFGDVERFTCLTKTVSIGNQGTATLQVSNVYRASTTSAEYTATPTIFSVAPGGSQDISVKYCPTDTNTDTGAITVSSNDPDTSHLNIGVSGTGTAPPPTNTSISLQLTWNTGVDIDTHLIRDGGTFAKGSAGDTSDCHWTNCKSTSSSRPDWGIVGDASDDPFLDVDDTNGYGPENINMTVASSGTYSAAAYYWSSTGAATAVKATIWLGGVQMYQETKTIYPNERWNIAAIAWDSTTSSGTVTMVGTTQFNPAFAGEVKPSDVAPAPHGPFTDLASPF